MVLASTADTISIDVLANLADKIMEVATPAPINMLLTSRSSSEMEQLCSQISDFQRFIQRLSKSRQRNPPHTHSPSPAPQQSQLNICWYHQKFGESAKKCRESCSMLGNALASSH